MKQAPGKIARMLGHLATLLGGMIEAPEAAIGDLPMLTPEEYQTLVYTWNDKPLDYPRDSCMHELIAERMRAMPDAPAVSLGGVTLSYRALERRTNQVARFLKERGVFLAYTIEDVRRELADLEAFRGA